MLQNNQEINIDISTIFGGVSDQHQSTFGGAVGVVIICRYQLGLRVKRKRNPESIDILDTWITG